MEVVRLVSNNVMSTLSDGAILNAAQNRVDSRWVLTLVSETGVAIGVDRLTGLGWNVAVTDGVAVCENSGQ